MAQKEEKEVADELKKTKDLIYSETWKKSSKVIENQDLVVLLGNTRCGKSTIVNFVIGNTLKVVRDKRKFKIINMDPPNTGPAIGDGATSKTTVPTVWTSKKVKGFVVDAPGFGDNRGIAQDVANAFYISQLINNAKSLKIVLICDIHDITSDNVSSFISFIDIIHIMMIQHDSNLYKGMILVFNKDTQNHSVAEIRDYLHDNVLSQFMMEVHNRDLVKHFYDNPTKIVVVGSPAGEGTASVGPMFKDITEAIENRCTMLARDELKHVEPGISDKSRVFLYMAHRQFSELKEFDNIANKIQKAFNNFLSRFEKYEGLSSDKLRQLKVELQEFENKIDRVLEKDNNTQKFLKEISILLPNLEEINSRSDVYVKLDFIQFVDFLLKYTESNMFLVRVKSIVVLTKQRSGQIQIKMLEKNLDISTQEAAIKMSTMQKEMAQLSEQLRKQIAMYEERQRESARQHENIKNKCTIL